MRSSRRRLGVRQGGRRWWRRSFVAGSGGGGGGGMVGGKLLAGVEMLAVDIDGRCFWKD